MLATPAARPWDAGMDQEPVLDPAAIDGLRSIAEGDGGAFFRELVDIFLTDTPKRLADLEQALAAGDLVTAGRAAHSVKGAAGNFGAAALARAALRAESEAKAGRGDAVRAALPAFRAEYERVEAALRGLRGA
jgi:HPt (histidine-containing phosphotransfer) domain-containing protein